MSPVNGADWKRLESSLQRLLDEFDELASKSARAEERVRQLEASLRSSSTATGEHDPVALSNRVHLLEQENRFLARRLDRARESVKRISARLQFLEEDR
jgi:chaperonin cofactor prefoldin